MHKRMSPCNAHWWWSKEFTLVIFKRKIHAENGILLNQIRNSITGWFDTSEDCVIDHPVSKFLDFCPISSLFLFIIFSQLSCIFTPVLYIISHILVKIFPKDIKENGSHQIKLEIQSSYRVTQHFLSVELLLITLYRLFRGDFLLIIFASEVRKKLLKTHRCMQNTHFFMHCARWCFFSLPRPPHHSLVIDSVTH